MKVGIIKYEAGNLQSVLNALEYNHVDWGLIEKKSDFDNYSHLLLPGVGAFPSAMKQLLEKDFVGPILKHIQSGNPFLGICVGFQLLLDSSDEKVFTEGLGVIKGRVRNFKEHTEGLLVPHVGWNFSRQEKESHFHLNESFYFTHSCFCLCENKEDILATTEYGVHFVSAIERDNVVGFQFHPEKSHQYGLNLFKTFEGLKC